MVLVEATPDGYHEKGRFTPPDPQAPPDRRKTGKAWTYPVVANGRLYVRDLGVLVVLRRARPKSLQIGGVSGRRAMTTKRVLSVGQCGFDNGGISHAFRQAFGAEVTAAATWRGHWNCWARRRSRWCWSTASSTPTENRAWN